MSALLALLPPFTCLNSLPFCKVTPYSHLSFYIQVVWVRQSDGQLLTVLTKKFSDDGRIVMSYRADRNDYCLIIKLACIALASTFRKGMHEVDLVYYLVNFLK